MAKERTSVRMQAQIRHMAEQGYSIRAIARVLRILRLTARKFLASPPVPHDPPAWVQAVDWESVQWEVYGRGTSYREQIKEKKSGLKKNGGTM